MSIEFKEKLKNYIEYVLEAIKLYRSDALKYASDKLPNFITIFLLSIRYGLYISKWLLFW